jgi:hypothetical protein
MYKAIRPIAAEIGMLSRWPALCKPHRRTGCRWRRWPRRSAREYLVASTFVGKSTGSGDTKLTGRSIKAGKQINPDASLTPGINLRFAKAQGVFGVF